MPTASTWALLPVIAASVLAHEWAHAWVARGISDPRARGPGQPVGPPGPGLDPLGMFLVPAVFVLVGAPFGFAWTKSAPVDRARLRDLRNGPLWVALAGPAVNGVLALALAGVARFTSGSEPASAVRIVAEGGVLWNCALAWFNLMPVPPLDGAWVLSRFLPLRHIVALHHARPFALAVIAAVALAPSPGRVLLLGPPRWAAEACFAAVGMPLR